MSWDIEWSPIVLEIYIGYLKFAKVCELNFNGDHEFEISEGNNKHIINLSKVTNEGKAINEEEETNEEAKKISDEEDVEPSLPRFTNDATVEDLPLTAPQPSQDSASSQSLFVKSFGQSIFGSSPSDPDFEYLGLEVKEDIL
ncbi:hypothetical protein HAX54_015291, partial [Datura stramonium]|nr:hypothetical protein [Datura stramonium]